MSQTLSSDREQAILFGCTVEGLIEKPKKVRKALRILATIPVERGYVSFAESLRCIHYYTTYHKGVYIIESNLGRVEVTDIRHVEYTKDKR